MLSESSDSEREAMADQPRQPQRVGPAARAWRWCARNPVGAGFLAAILAAALALVAVVIAFVDQERVRTSELPERSAGRTGVTAQRTLDQEKGKIRAGTPPAEPNTGGRQKSVEKTAAPRPYTDPLTRSSGEKVSADEY